MTGVRWVGAWLLVGTALFATGVGELSAQSQGPIKLFPDLQEDDATGAQDARPQAEPRSTPPDDPSNEAEPAAEGIVVESLDAPSIDALGLEDGLGVQIWDGSGIDRVTRLIEELPTPRTNPALIDFTRRLLLTGTSGTSALAPGTMLTRRVEQLIRLGALDDASQLLDQIPETDVDEPVTRRAAELALWRGERDRACQLGNSIEQSAGGTFWSKLRVFCRQSAGASDEAELALALLRDSVDQADRRFMALAEGQTNGALETGEPWTALEVAMLSTSDGQLPLPALVEPPAALAQAIARRPALASERTLEIAERAFLAGAIDRDRLIELYQASNPAAEAVDGGAAARATAFESMVAAEAPAEQVRTFDRLWVSLPPEERVLAAYLFAPELDTLSPTDELLFGASSIARALLAAGYPRPAAAWLALLEDAAADDVSARAALDGLRPLFAVAGEDGAAPVLDLAMLEAWRSAVDPDSLLEARLLALAEAARGELALKLWWAADRRKLEPTPDFGRPIFWRVLERAEQRGAVGEALLAGLNLLQGDPAEAHPEAARAGLIAIRNAGFDDVVREVAAACLIELGL